MKNFEEARAWILRVPLRFISRLLLTPLASCGVPEAGPDIGHLLPEIRAQNIQGQLQIVSRRDAPCILFFYNPSCRPCNRLLESLYPYFEEQEKSQARLLLMVRRGQQEALREQTIPSRLPVFMISSSTWHDLFQITRTPVLLFYQAQGRLIHKQIGWKSPVVQKRILQEFLLEIRRSTLAGLDRLLLRLGKDSTLEDGFDKHIKQRRL